LKFTHIFVISFRWQKSGNSFIEFLLPPVWSNYKRQRLTYLVQFLGVSHLWKQNIFVRMVGYRHL
jgi:hypothetical protein